LRNETKDDATDDISNINGIGTGHQAKGAASYVMMTMMVVVMMMMITSTHGQRSLELGRENYGKFQASERQSVAFILEHYRKYKQINIV
jgi:hypothetical protein